MPPMSLGLDGWGMEIGQSGGNNPAFGQQFITVQDVNGLEQIVTVTDTNGFEQKLTSATGVA